MARGGEVERVKRAAKRVRSTEGELEDARRELQAALVAAHEAGVSYAALGRVLGVSRQRVAEIVRRETP